MAEFPRAATLLSRSSQERNDGFFASLLFVSEQVELNWSTVLVCLRRAGIFPRSSCCGGAPKNGISGATGAQEQNAPQMCVM